MGDTGMVVLMRLFDRDGVLLTPQTATLNGGNELAPKATLPIGRESIKSLGFESQKSLWAEIFPAQVEQRCNGKMLMQLLLKNKASPVTTNHMPVD